MKSERNSYDEVVKAAVEAWSVKLLDLSARNRLIRFVKGDYALHIAQPSPETLYDRMQSGKALSFNRPLEQSDDRATHSAVRLMGLLGHPMTVTVGDIYLSREGDPTRNLGKLGKKAKEALEERGINMLYLVFGFVKWTEKGKSVERYAPLLLMPVNMSENHAKRTYTVTRREDDVVLNGTLQYFFKKEKNKDLPEPDKEDLKDGESMRRYIEKVREELGDLAEVVEGAGVGILGDTKVSMYRDLVENRDRIARHPFIRAILKDPATTLPTVPERVTHSAVARRLVLGADSSQELAVEAAMKGCSFVLDGPPGTGKSQTIANIIAAMIAEGKKVLFVSQKYAALDVVVRRLEEAGLADFYLALHSYRSGKKGIISNINKTMQQTGESLTAEEERLLSAYFEREAELGAYINALHEKLQPLGKSVYDIFCELEGLGEVDLLNLAISDPLCYDGKSYYARINALEVYEKACRKAEGRIDARLWQGYDLSKEGFDATAKLSGLLSEAILSLTRLEEAVKELGDALSPADHSFKTLGEALHSLKLRLEPYALPKKLLRDRQELLRVTSMVEGLAADLRSAEEQGAPLKAIFKDSAKTLSIDELLDEEERARKSLLASGLFFPTELTRSEREAYLMTNKGELLAKAREAYKALQSLEKTFDLLEGALGLTLEGKKSNFSQYEIALGVLLDGYVFPRGYSADKLPIYRRAFDRREALETERRELRERILVRWNKEVFAVEDPARALSRFDNSLSTRSGMVQVYRKHYKGIVNADQVRVLWVELSSLRSIDTELAECRAILTEASGKKVMPVEWQQIVDALATYKQLESGGLLSEKLRGLLERGLTNEEKTRFSMALHELKTGYTKTAELINSFCADKSLRYQAIPVIKERLGAIGKELAALVSIGDTLAPHLLKNDLSPAALRKSLLDYSLYLTLRESAEKRLESLAKVFGKGFYENDPTCEALLLGLKQAAEGEAGGLSPKERAHLRPLIGEAEECYRSARTLLCDLEGELKTDLRAIPWESAKSQLVEYSETVENLGYLVAVDKAKRSCKELGLEPFMAAYDSRRREADPPRGSMAEIYRKTFLNACYRAAREKNSALLFSKEAHETLLDEYRELDGKRLELAKKAARASVISRFKPSSFATLKKYNNERKKDLPSLRNILLETAKALFRLKPCMMMSPVSVSYYFKEAKNRTKDAIHFDAVIFDEASQIYLEDAIGAISRADQVIIAGDINQLPPTSFFKGVDAVGGDGEEQEEGEASKNGQKLLQSLNISPNASLLDVCTGSPVIPQITLLWHYRSLHEHLIALSNEEIYSGSLITFPATCPSGQDMGVESVFVEGGYSEKRKSRDGEKESDHAVINRLEAERCLELVKEHIERYSAKGNRRSLGIIAFGLPQQEEIQDLINQYRAHEYQPVDGYDFFAETNDAPFFVKNIETVQGDERDTVIISLCHGKTREGKIQNNFGPAGQDGGERRLNVAITRAKINVKLVHSVHYHQIGMLKNGKETEATGLKMIRDYLHFAEKGGYLPTKREVKPCEDALVAHIVRFLRGKDFSVAESYGYSENKLDIAVYDPRDPKKMLAAIITDGYSTLTAKTVRDRELLRDSKLEERKWKIYRVWSSAWMQNPKKEEEALISFLEKLMSEAPEGEILHTASDHYGFYPYKRTDFSDMPEAHSTRKGDRDASALTHLLYTEAPIHVSLLYERMAEYLGESGVTDTVRSTVELLLHSRLANRIHRDATFVYLKNEPILPRRGDSPQAKRRPSHISPKEWQEGILYVLAAKPLSEGELYRAVADSFGYLTGESGVREAIDSALLRLFLDSRVSMNRSNISIVRTRT